MRYCLFALALVIGCGRSEPVLFDGKPVSHWVDELNKPEPKARKKAVTALGAAAIAAQEARSALLGAMEDSDPDVRHAVCVALLNLGRAAGRDASAILEKASSDPDARVREAAARALKRVQGQIE